jgi:putative tributyrin esterase
MLKLVDGVVYSSLINKNVPYRALVPEAVSQRVHRPRVLYLLHGLFGTYENWTEFTNLRKSVEDPSFLIVMPDGGDNWYTDSDERHEGYLIHDLVPEIEHLFGIGSEGCERAIAGNSMGGYGALKLALKYPEMFSFAASFSGAFHATRLAGDANDDVLAPSILRVFGDGSSAVRSENDLFAIARRASTRSGGLPRIYFDCGVDDEFIDVNREFAALLSTIGIKHQFLEIDGSHDWPYWDERIRHLLSILEESFS